MPVLKEEPEASRETADNRQSNLHEEEKKQGGVQNYINEEIERINKANEINQSYRYGKEFDVFNIKDNF